MKWFVKAKMGSVVVNGETLERADRKARFTSRGDAYEFASSCFEDGARSVMIRPEGVDDETH